MASVIEWHRVSDGIGYRMASGIGYQIPVIGYRFLVIYRLNIRLPRIQYPISCREQEKRAVQKRNIANMKKKQKNKTSIIRTQTKLRQTKPTGTLKNE